MQNKQVFSCICYDGTFDGVVVLQHELLVGYKMPYCQQKNIQTKISEKEFSALSNCGVYLLFNITYTGQLEVYVGQGSSRDNGKGVFIRISENHPSCNAWTHALMFVSGTANPYNKTDISYFERKLYDFAKEAGRYYVLNKKRPSGDDLTPAREIQLDGSLELMKLATRILGFDVFEPVARSKGSRDVLPSPKKKVPFSFSLCGIRTGDYIEWHDDPNKKFKVVGEKSVIYNGEEMSLSKLAKEISGKPYALNGVLFFKYKGEYLNDIRSSKGN